MDEKNVNVKIDVLNPKNDDTQRIVSKLDELIAFLKNESRTPKPKPGKSGSKKTVSTRGRVAREADEQLDDELKKTERSLIDLFKQTGRLFRQVRAGISMVEETYGKMISSSVRALTTASQKFITSSSLLVDKEIASMMQRTGQTAFEAQATTRSLEMLGLSFEDLQMGMLTEAQAEAFEQIRERELRKLEEIALRGEDSFAIIQQAQITMKQTVLDLRDGFLLMLTENQDVISSVVETTKEIMPAIVDAVEVLMPIISSVLDTFPILLEGIVPAISIVKDAALEVFPVFTEVLEGVISIVVELLPIFETAVGLLSDTMPVLGEIVATLGVGLTSILQELVPMISALIESLSPVLESVLLLIQVLLPPVFAILQAIMPIISILIEGISMLLEVISPIIDLVTIILMPIMKGITELFDELGTVLRWVADVVNPLLKWIGDLAHALGEFLKTIIRTVNTLFGWLGVHIDEGVKKVGISSDDPFLDKLRAIRTSNNNITSSSDVTNNYNYGGVGVVNKERIVNSNATVKLNVGGYGA